MVAMDDLPTGIWLKDNSLIYQYCNNKTLTIVSFKKNNQLLGKKDVNLPWAQFSPAYNNEGKKVIAEGEGICMINPGTKKNGDIIMLYVKKMPYFYQNERCILGIAWELDNASIKQLNRTIESASTLDVAQYYLIDKYEKYNLSLKESECLFYVARGKTSKQIASLLSLSPRTVESRLETIKYKMNCQSKPELIELALANNYHSMLPKTLLTSFPMMQ